MVRSFALEQRGGPGLACDGAMMMGHKYSLIARWGPRAESAQECGARLAVMLSELAKANEVFGRWNEQGYRPAEWNRPFCTMPPRADELATTDAAGLRRILLAVVAGWEPDCAEVIEFGAHAETWPTAEAQPPFRAGWMTYLAPRFGKGVAPPPEAISEQVPGGGLLMRATHEPFALANPAHRAAVATIQRALAPIQGMVRAGYSRSAS